MDGPWLGWSPCLLPKVCPYFLSIAQVWNVVCQACTLPSVCLPHRCLLFPHVLFVGGMSFRRRCVHWLSASLLVLYGSPLPQPWFFHSCPGPASWGRFWLWCQGPSEMCYHGLKFVCTDAPISCSSATLMEPFEQHDPEHLLTRSLVPVPDASRAPVILDVVVTCVEPLISRIGLALSFSSPSFCSVSVAITRG